MEFRKAKSNDDPVAIGTLIYNTDRWVYPALFGDIDIAIAATPALLAGDCVYNHDNMYVAVEDGKIAGYMALTNGAPSGNRKCFEQAILGSGAALPPAFDSVMREYFDLVKPDPDKTEVLSLSVLPEFRRRGVASFMLSKLDPNITYTLACVRDNAPARELYRKAGFEFMFEYPGYTGIPCVELIRHKRGDNQ